MRHIVSISVAETYESCERYTYYVTLKTDEGFAITPASYATGSIYTNGKGLSRGEARDLALIDAASWGDLLEIEPETFVGSEGQTFAPSMTLNSYSTRRELAKRKS